MGDNIAGGTVTDIFLVTVSASPTSGVIPLTVELTAAIVGGTPPYTYVWDFGDGSPLSTEAHPTHPYSGIGTYTITCTVVDAAVKAAQSTVNVTSKTGIAQVTTGLAATEAVTRAETAVEGVSKAPSETIGRTETAVEGVGKQPTAEEASRAESLVITNV